MEFHAFKRKNELKHDNKSEKDILHKIKIQDYKYRIYNIKKKLRKKTA